MSHEDQAHDKAPPRREGSVTQNAIALLGRRRSPTALSASSSVASLVQLVDEDVTDSDFVLSVPLPQSPGGSSGFDSPPGRALVRKATIKQLQRHLSGEEILGEDTMVDEDDAAMIRQVVQWKRQAEELVLAREELAALQREYEFVYSQQGQPVAIDRSREVLELRALVESLREDLHEARAEQRDAMAAARAAELAADDVRTQADRAKTLWAVEAEASKQHALVAAVAAWTADHATALEQCRETACKEYQGKAAILGEQNSRLLSQVEELQKQLGEAKAAMVETKRSLQAKEQELQKQLGEAKAAMVETKRSLQAKEQELRRVIAETRTAVVSPDHTTAAMASSSSPPTTASPSQRRDHTASSPSTTTSPSKQRDHTGYKDALRMSRVALELEREHRKRLETELRDLRLQVARTTNRAEERERKLVAENESLRTLLRAAGVQSTTEVPIAEHVPKLLDAARREVRAMAIHAARQKTALVEWRDRCQELEKHASSLLQGTLARVIVPE
jgi:hypothetical protein